LITAAFDPYLPAFARLIPVLVADYDALPARDKLRKSLAGQIGPAAPLGLRAGASRRCRRRWRCSGAIRSGTSAMPSRRPGDDRLRLHGRKGRAEGSPARAGRSVGSAAEGLRSLGRSVGEVNRYQRIDGAIVQAFDDAKPSIPCPSSPRAGARSRRSAPIVGPAPGGTTAPAATVSSPSSNSGKGQLRAPITVGGERRPPQSPHFSDEARALHDG
jgi:acyl-homoserine-lactone acylase